MSTRLFARAVAAGFVALGAACHDGTAPNEPIPRPRRERPSFQLTTAIAPNWTQLFPPTSPPARSAHSMATSVNGVLLFGGEETVNLDTVFIEGFPVVIGDRRPLGDTWEWTGSTWRQAAPPKSTVDQPIPSPRWGASLAFDPNRKEVVLFGGCGGSFPFVPMGDTWVFRSGLFTKETGWVKRNPVPSPPARCFASMAYDDSRAEMVLVGGATRPGNSLQQVFDDQWIWNGTGWRQVTQARLIGPRWRSGMAYHQDTRELVLFSGSNELWFAVADACGSISLGIWKGHGGAFACFPFVANQPLPPPRPAWGGFTAYPPGGTIVLFANPTPFATLNRDVWTWNGTQWLEQFPATPSSRMEHGMAYDAKRGNLVLFGGNRNFAGSHMNDTWTWGRQVACLPRDGSNIPVGSQVECFFKLGTGAELVGWDANGFSPRRETNTTARFHTNGAGPAVIRVSWTDGEGEHTTEMHFTVVHRSK